MKRVYNKIKSWYLKYERLLMPGTLVFGVATDLFTFRSIQIFYTFLILGLHVCFAGIAIAYLNLYDAGRVKKGSRFLDYLRLGAPLAIQFSFGALASASFIFYFFSGSFFVSWPLILIIVFLMLANEIFREYYARAEVHMAVYYFLVFSIFAIVLPFALKKLGAGIFILSGAASLVFIAIYISLLSRAVKKSEFGFRLFGWLIAAVFVIMNGFYFLNIIPPIPLSLREAVVGQSIARSDGNYTILIEKESFWDKILSERTVHKTPGGEVVVYTAIFAPGKLETGIIHDWQHKENGKWISKSQLSFVIIGGRQDGFRGYSIKTAVPEGEWRVDVKTARGQVLGRVYFNVIEVPAPPPLVEVVK